ncbi:MAG: GGDEF domain-containing protein [Alkalispirochaeta sp.]
MPNQTDTISSPTGTTWKIVLIAGLLMAFVYVLVPYGTFPAILYVAATAVAALGTGMTILRRYKPNCTTAWVLIGLALALAALGHAIWYWLDLHGLEPFPSVADAFYLVVYPLFMIALWLLGHHSGHGDGSVSDALIVGVSAAVPGWALLIAPYIHDPDLTTLQLLISAAYPVADLILLPMIFRLMFFRPTRNRAFRFLLLGMLAYLIADILYAHGTSSGWYSPGGLTDGLWLVSYTLIVTAVWHPSASVSPEHRGAMFEAPGHRLVILGAASLLSPATILLAAGTSVEIVRVAAIASIFLFLIVMYRMRGLMRKVQRQSEAIEQQSLTDPLTGATNRRYLDRELPRELARATRANMPLNLAYLDLDHFKAYNDAHGHSAGDELLRAVVEAWKRTLRPSDILARIGGEEFVFVFPESNGKQCRRVVERLRSVVPYGQTCSAGVTQFLREDTIDSMIARADRALYQAKNAGRNQTVIAQYPESYFKRPPAPETGH